MVCVSTVSCSKTSGLDWTGFPTLLSPGSFVPSHLLLLMSDWFISDEAILSLLPVMLSDWELILVCKACSWQNCFLLIWLVEWQEHRKDGTWFLRKTSHVNEAILFPALAQCCNCISFYHFCFKHAVTCCREILPHFTGCGISVNVTELARASNTIVCFILIRVTWIK